LTLLSSTPTAPTEIYTLSLHDALPIFDEVAAAEQRAEHGQRPEAGKAVDRLLGLVLDQAGHCHRAARRNLQRGLGAAGLDRRDRDRKSTRLNSSHVSISYAVFCLKKKK